MITLRGEDGETAPADATIDAYPEAARIGKAVGFFVGGFVLGGACIFVPVLHLITTWALPLAGIVFGLRTLKIDRAFGPITGRCPRCDKPIELRGGPIKASNWRVCPECRKDIEVLAEEPPQTDMLE
jgi:hypothetical protein